MKAYLEIVELEDVVTVSGSSSEGTGGFDPDCMCRGGCTDDQSDLD